MRLKHCCQISITNRYLLKQYCGLENYFIYIPIKKTILLNYINDYTFGLSYQDYDLVLKFGISYTCSEAMRV